MIYSVRDDFTGIKKRYFSKMEEDVTDSFLYLGVHQRTKKTWKKIALTMLKFYKKKTDPGSEKIQREDIEKILSLFEEELTAFYHAVIKYERCMELI